MKKKKTNKTVGGRKDTIEGINDDLEEAEKAAVFYQPMQLCDYDNMVEIDSDGEGKIERQ